MILLSSKKWNEVKETLLVLRALVNAQLELTEDMIESQANNNKILLQKIETLEVELELMQNKIAKNVSS